MAGGTSIAEGFDRPKSKGRWQLKRLLIYQILLVCVAAIVVLTLRAQQMASVMLNESGLQSTPIASISYLDDQIDTVFSDIAEELARRPHTAAFSDIVEGQFTNCSIDKSKIEELFSYSVTTETFSVSSLLRDKYILFASMKSESGHYGCFMEAKGTQYACPGVKNLLPDKWAVTITLVRSQCPMKLNPLRQPLLQYMLEHNISLFSDLQEHVAYYYTIALKFWWDKGEQPALASKIQCKNEPLGQWIEYPGSCEPPLCSGNLDVAFINSESSVKRQMKHVFSPFNCYYHHFTKQEVSQCLKDNRLLLVGDSRMRSVHMHLETWLNETVEYLPVRDPDMAGLNKFWRSEDYAQVYEALIQGRTVFFNTLLHDLRDFGDVYPTSTIRAYWDMNECGMCVGLAKECNCTSKQFTAQRYVRNIKKLADFLESIPRHHQGKFHWVLQHRQPPRLNQFLGFGGIWVSSDILYVLEDIVVSILRKVGVSHIDLRPHILSAPHEWFDDDVHFGKSGDDLFQHVSLQIMLNRICKVK